MKKFLLSALLCVSIPLFVAYMAGCEDNSVYDADHTSSDPAASSGTNIFSGGSSGTGAILRLTFLLTWDENNTADYYDELDLQVTSPSGDSYKLGWWDDKTDDPYTSTRDGGVLVQTHDPDRARYYSRASEEMYWNLRYAPHGDYKVNVVYKNVVDVQAGHVYAIIGDSTNTYTLPDAVDNNYTHSFTHTY
ncbi:hypothetical protein ACFLS1_11125 [Verrucomicrobiota bacterium]